MRKSNHKLSMIMLLLALAAAAFIPSKITHAQPTILLKVEPETYTATRMGETFDINVTINNVEATDKVIGIEFKLHYNTSLLEVVDVAEGPFLAQFNNTPTEPYVYFIYYVEEDYVVVGLYLMPNATGYHNVYPEGSGTITTITFKTLPMPSSQCDLTLDWVLLIDSDGVEIPCYIESGHYSMPYEVLVHQIQWEERVFTVTTESNGTVNPVPMIFNQTYGYLMFNLTGADGEVIYCKVEIPKELLYSSGEWLIIVGGERVLYTKSENETHTILYFKTTASTKSVYIFGTEVVPEFPIPILWMAILASAAAALTLSRSFIKRKSKA